MSGITDPFLFWNPSFYFENQDFSYSPVFLSIDLKSEITDQVDNLPARGIFLLHVNNQLKRKNYLV